MKILRKIRVDKLSRKFAPKKTPINPPNAKKSGSRHKDREVKSNSPAIKNTKVTSNKNPTKATSGIVVNAVPVDLKKGTL